MHGSRAKAELVNAAGSAECVDGDGVVVVVDVRASVGVDGVDTRLSANGSLSEIAVVCISDVSSSRCGSKWQASGAFWQDLQSRRCLPSSVLAGGALMVQFCEA